MCRGKGDYYRLGTDSSSHVTEPQLVEALKKKVIQIAVGSLHCLALTESGEVCIYVTQDLVGVGLWVWPNYL